MGASGGFMTSLKGYLSDPGFWASVVVVSIVVSTALVIIKAPGHRS